MPVSPKALIFDLNGTMIDDMEYHAIAWHKILTNDLGAVMTLDEVRGHMYGKNEEVLTRIFGDRFSLDEMKSISIEKERRYQAAFRPNLKLIDGLENFLKLARANHVKLGIGTAAIPFNVDFVLDEMNIRHYFEYIVTADDVQKSKPHPETFLQVSSYLNVEPHLCLVFEDAPKGVESAQNGGFKSVVLTTTHSQKDFNYLSAIEFFIDDYNDPRLLKLWE